MKRLLTIAMGLSLAGAAFAQAYKAEPAQPVGTYARRSADAYVHSPNYELAERFSAKRTEKMVFSTAIRPNWFQFSDKFWYSWKTSQGTRYYIVDPAKGSKTEIFDMVRLAMQITEITRDPYDAAHLPIENLKLKEDKYFTFDITSSQNLPEKKGKKPVKKIHHFKYVISSGELIDETGDGEKIKKKYPSWATVSPDGTLGVYKKGNNLYVMDSVSLHKAAIDEKDSTIVERALTKDGSTDKAWGSDNYKGSVKRDSTKREKASEVMWSPDSRHLAAIRWDMSKVKMFWVINSLSMPRPKLESYKYQMPGEPGPKGELYVIDTQTGDIRHISTAAFKDQDINIERAPVKTANLYKDWQMSHWLGDEKGFYLSRISRDLKRLDMCRVDIDADSAKVIVPERMNTYIEGRAHRLLRGGKQFIHWSERNGWANLYLYNSDGTLVRNLTEGAFHVQDVLAVNEAEGYVLFSACGREKDENPYQMHTYRVALSGGTPQLLDMPDMNVEAVASEDGKYFVANCSRVDCKPTSALYNASGKKIMDLEEADFSLLYAAGYKFPERFKVKAADGITDLYGAIYKPFDFDSTKVYPVCDYVYPGPQVEANNISWSKNFTRVDRLAQLGFIVITVGNRGGHPNRSKWYHNYGYGNLRDYGLEDQKYAIQQLGAKYAWMDLERVGIHGHSGGGFMSTAALLTYPDFFKAAVSCSGNHDNRIYNRWWSEQHHGIMEKVVESDTSFVYGIHTNQELVKNLKGHLMLVTGDIDDNVHPANTIRVVDALIKANKRFEFVLMPGQRHGYTDMNEYFFWKMADWYCEWLMGSSRRGEPDISQMNNM